MPRITAATGARIFERLELEPRLGKTDATTIREQALAIRRDEMGHLRAAPHMAMQPEPAGHRVAHAFAPDRELAPHNVQRCGVRLY